MPSTLAFFPSPEDLDDDLFGVPALSWSDPTPPSPEPPTAAPGEAQ